MTSRQPFGILNVDKPAGMTSRRAVDRVAALVKPAKAGHTGTLDPLATGVLAICVGPATRLVEYVQRQPKEYRARFLLGRESDTDDVTGKVVETAGSRPVSREDLERLLPEFVGAIEQVPPQFSAVHVGGRRAHELARQGREVELEPRTVEVFALELTAFDFPEFELLIECGSGTYVRSIGRDLGRRLGCGAVMGALLRTRVGPYRLEDATKLDEITAGTIGERLLSPVTAVADLPRHVIAPEEETVIGRGRSVRVADAAGWSDRDTVAVVTGDGRLACLAEYRTDGRLAPRSVFLGAGG